MNVLILDDEKEIADLVEVYLQNENYNVYKFYTSEKAINCIDNVPLDLAILDIMIQGKNGFEICKYIRDKGFKFPIIMLTAKIEDNDKIKGLTLGADDYITKPFNPLELIARVKSQLRRYTMLGAVAVETSCVYKTGNLWIDDERKIVSVEGEEVKLTPIDYKILLFLTKHAGRVFSIEQIYENVWEADPYGADNTVAVHIRRIREKIEINPREPKYLKVVWGVGYKIEKIS